MQKAVIGTVALVLGLGGARSLAADPPPTAVPPPKPGQQIHLGPSSAPSNPAARPTPNAPASPASPAPASPAAQGAADPAVDQALKALDERGQGLKSFDANVKLVETDNNLALDTTRTGHVWYQKLASGDERIRVVFDKRLTDKQKFDEKIEYLLDKGWLTDRDYQKRIEVRRQVLKPGQKLNLLKLGEGPFPLPIGQKPEDVKRQFQVKKVKPSKEDDPAGGPTTHLLLKPLPDTQFARRFSAIDVWVDPSNSMPRRIATTDRNGTTTRSTDLSTVRLNPNLGDAEFTPEKIKPEQWNTREEPYAE